MPTACQLCPSPLATVHLTELSADGTRSEVHVCRECVGRLGIALDNPPPLVPLLAQAQALAAAHAGETVESVSVPAPAEGESCPQCGLEFTAYAQSNLFGCVECYSTFAPQVAELVQRYHGASRHVGRVPGGTMASAPTEDEALLTQRAADQRRIAKQSARHSLTLALADAIAREQFERAAALRDQLTALDDDLAEGVV